MVRTKQRKKTVSKTMDLTMVEAVNRALARAMAEDETVIVLGQDVGADGGVFRATDGLFSRFGEARVRGGPVHERRL